MRYPPEPWRLRGSMHVSVWALPRADLPPIPPEITGALHVATIGTRALVGAAWVDYQPGGDMTYRELVAAVLMRAGLRPRVTITDIWVDSAASRDGGRDLWGIPKEMADFELAETQARAESAGQMLASATLARGVRLPLRWAVTFRVTQVHQGKPKTTRVRMTARVAIATARWQVPPTGPLRFLSHRRPLVSIVLSDFRMHFGGPASERQATA